MKKIFYTDGSSKGNPGPGSYGVAEYDIKSNIIFYIYSEYFKNVTNNQMELKAILHVIKLTAADKENSYLVYSDSAYAVNSINIWMWSWAKSNWRNSKNEEVKNIDLVKNLYYLYDNKKTSICQIHKVKGHLGLDVKGNIDAIGNKIADALATDDEIGLNLSLWK